MTSGAATHSEPMAAQLQRALELQLQGRHAEAEGILLAVLGVWPDCAEALHYLGVLRHLQGRSAEAMELLQRSIGLCPTYAAAHNNMGNVLRALGQERAAGGRPGPVAG